MRITNNMMVDSMLADLNNNLERMLKTQKQLSTGLKFTLPSEDPVGTSRTLILKETLKSNDQFLKNANDGLSWLQITDSALNQMTKDMQRLRELAVQGSNGTLTKEDTNSLAKEVQQIKGDIINIGNTTYTGRYIFGGFDTQNPPLNVDGNGNVSYRIGTSLQEIQYDVGLSNKITINVEAYQVFGSNFFTDLDNLISNLQNGDNAGVSNLIGKIDGYINNMLSVRADIGARENRLQLVQDRLQDDNINYTGLLSKTQDVDIAQVAMNLANDQNVYQASLMLGSKIIMPTLMDFMR